MHIGTVKQYFIAFFLFLCAQFKRFRTWDLPDVNVTVSHRRTMGLQFNLLFSKDRQVPVPVILQDHIVGHQLPVQVNCNTVALH
ncbi:hypothetical protein D3C87_1589390 [compost metagenome]